MAEKYILLSAALSVAAAWCPDDDGSVGKTGDLREMLDELEAIEPADVRPVEWIPVRERLPVIKAGHARTKDIVVWLEGAGLAITRRYEYHTARNWTWNSRRVTHWLSVSPPADDEPERDRETADGDRLEASFHGESWSKCRLCGKTYEAHSLIRGKNQDEYYCPYCFGYGKEDDNGNPQD